MTNKEEYRLFCESEKNNMPIYSQYWWMEAVCAEKSWDVLLVRNNRQEIIASLPYLFDEKVILKYVQMPVLTQTNGIYIKKGEEQRKDSITADLQSQIERLNLDVFYQNFPASPVDKDKFKEKGYTIKERTSYIIENTPDIIDLFKSLDQSKQRQIKKAQRNNLRLYRDKMTVEQFYAYHDHLLSKRGMRNQIPQIIFTRLAKKALERNQGCIWSIEGEDGETQSALFMVWDGQKAYYLVPANDRDYSTTGAPTMLTWEAIKWTMQKGKTFDFEGSMIPSIAKNYSQFGSTPTSYHQLVKTFSITGKIWAKIKLR